jgi:hypothetical protein
MIARVVKVWVKSTKWILMGNIEDHDGKNYYRAKVNSVRTT